MMRFLRHNKSTRTNTLVAWFHASMLPTEATADKQHKSYRLATWRLEGGRFEGGELTRRFCHTGSVPSEFWDAVYQHMSIDRPLWLWGQYLVPQLTSLWLWDEIERECFSFDEPLAAYHSRKAKFSRARRKHGLCVLGDPPIIMKLWSQDGKQLVICDARNWYEIPSPTSETSSLAVPQSWWTFPQKIDQLNIIDQVWTGLIGEAIQANYRFVRDMDLGVMKYTLAGQSMAAFQHRFMKHKILLHDHIEIKKCERASYYAGRVEPFYIGEIGKHDFNRLVAWHNQDDSSSPPVMGPIHMVDCNSMYGHVMKYNYFPTKYVMTVNDPPEDEAKGFHGDYMTIADVTIDSGTHQYPYRLKNDVIYPRGVYRTWLADPEYGKALARGHVKQTHQLVCYQTEQLFAEWVKEIYKARLASKMNGNSQYDKLCRLLLCSLYGKWAQMESPWIDCKGEVAPIPWGTYVMQTIGDEVPSVYRAIGGHPQRQGERKELPWNFPAISAFVTSYARVFMDNIRDAIGNDKILYQGVDSLIVTADGLDAMKTANLIDPDELGKFKVKEGGCDGHIYGQHDYRIGDKTVIGWKSCEARKRSDGNFQDTIWSGIDAIIAQRPQEGPTSMEIVKQRIAGCRRGIILPSGWVVPLCVGVDI